MSFYISFPDRPTLILELDKYPFTYQIYESIPPGYILLDKHSRSIGPFSESKQEGIVDGSTIQTKIDVSIDIRKGAKERDMSILRKEIVSQLSFTEYKDLMDELDDKKNQQDDFIETFRGKLMRVFLS